MMSKSGHKLQLDSSVYLLTAFLLPLQKREMRIHLQRVLGYGWGKTKGKHHLVVNCSGFRPCFCHPSSFHWVYIGKDKQCNYHSNYCLYFSAIASVGVYYKFIIRTKNLSGFYELLIKSDNRSLFHVQNRDPYSNYIFGISTFVNNRNDKIFESWSWFHFDQTKVCYNT